jgi:ATP-binding cassette, subfamily B, multidrug efflux pump
VKELLKLNRYFLKYKWTLVLGSVLLILSNFFLIWIPIFIRMTMDEIERMADRMEEPVQGVFQTLFSADTGWFLAQNTGLLVGAVLLYGLLLFATRQTLIVTSRKIEFDLRNEIFDHLQKLPKSFYDNTRSGDVYTRATEDVVRVREYFGPAFMYTVNTFSRSAIIIVIMVMVDARLTFWALLPLPLLAVMAYWVSRYINRRSNEIQQQYAVMAGKVQEIYSSIRVIKAFNRENYEKDRFNQENESYRRKKLRLDLVESLFHPMLLLLIGSSIVLVVWQGGLMVMEGQVTIGNIAEFIIYVTYLTWPVASLGYTLNLMQRSAASNSRIQKLMAIPTEEVDGKPPADRTHSTSHDRVGKAKTIHSVNPQSFSGKIVFDRVTFTYPGSEEPALSDISMHIRKGDRIGIVGRTGAGKTSLVQLIPRIYDPQKGRILLDGTDIRDIPMGELRSLIGFVPQDNFLFSDTIHENITFGKEDATEEEVRQAAAQAEVLENILEFEKKFDTILGERGITLSGGQKQRTSIARALIRKPSIIVLDDSLSAVDSRTEDAIVQHLDSELGDVTMFIICHRLSSLKHVNTIYVLDEGRIVESGSHEELMERNGFFANMYRKQLIENELEHI